MGFKWTRCLIFGFSAPDESVPPLLNAHATSSDVRRDATTRAVVSEVHHEVVDTRAMVSEIHRKMLESQEGAGGEHQSVSVIRILSPNTRLLLDRLGIGQRSRLLLGPTSYVCI